MVPSMGRTENRTQRVVYMTDDDQRAATDVITRTGIVGPTMQHRLGLRAILALPERTMKKLLAALAKENT